MIEIKLDLSDLDIFGKFKETAKIELDDAILAIAHLIRNTAVKGISQGTRSGRLYRKGGRILHRASAPYEYPKTNTGRLVSSIRIDHSLLKAEIGSDVIYSSFLEEGTQKMFPRPWLNPSLDANLNDMERIIDRAIQRALSK